MKIALFGATGRLGTETMVAAVTAGHQVIALARRADKLPTTDAITHAPLNLDDPASVAEHLAGADAAIVTIGSRHRASGLADALPAIAEACRLAGVRRVIQVGAFGAGASARLGSWRARISYATIERAKLRDHADGAAAVDHTALEWTTVLPVRLREGDATPIYAMVPMELVVKVPALPLLPYANVAQATLDLATRTEHVPGPLLLTTAGGAKVLAGE